jgi:hypothetical protein
MTRPPRSNAESPERSPGRSIMCCYVRRSCFTLVWSGKVMRNDPQRWTR